VAAPVLSAALLAAGEVTVPAAAAAAADATGALLLLLLPLSPAAVLAPVLLPVTGFLLPVLGSLLTRVAAVALNSVDLGAGSLNAPGLTAVRCCCFISLQALNLARMSPVPAGCCAETVPVRSALNIPGLSPAAADLLLIATDMLRPRGVCMTCCLECGATLTALGACMLLLAVLGPIMGAAAGAGVVNCCSGACRCSACRGPAAGVGSGTPPRALLPLAAVLEPTLPPDAMKGVAAWFGCCSSAQPALLSPARLARPVSGPL
jgi:hypothetical protein